MDTCKIDTKGVRMVAHRGLSGIERENTVAAFIAAGNRSYFGIETDVRRTADGKYVISHDETLLRVSGEDVNIGASTLEDIQRVVLTDIDGSRTRLDLCAPTLDDYISVCKKYGKHCVLELKQDFSLSEVQEILDVINARDYLESVTFISFHYGSLKNVLTLSPGQSVQVLIGEQPDGFFVNAARDGMDIDAHHDTLTREKIARIHELGMKVNAWTVDSAERAAELIDMGVDFITTNILE